ncbi:putative nucleotidyltransferase [Novipirellula aureliae]|uniref:Putative nucleotidyltransferase n=1 Tax=Novipirellula aureliae TaxID=2527966 RepID=A0A5C6DU23_9BACT|nr:nucleotidyltransferase domain-containing protein [Novipirellula aureliae]TWU40202.1 putative nucleotidyltransferase [Novipirellula aureliae]
MIDYDKMMQHVSVHPHPLLFATISGAHLYGFPSPDSDFDLRGVHLLPIETVLGLDDGDQTVEKEGIYDGLEIDLVTHDASKFFALMLRRNGYVLEQIFSPLVVFEADEFAELKSIAADCITKHHAHHYLGFAATQWKLFGKESPPRVKPLLYVYRVLLTGIHLMRTGEVEANLVKRNETAKLPFLGDLIAQKQSGPEKGTLSAADLDFHTTQYERLTAELEAAYEVSNLRDLPTARPALNDLLVRLRLGNFSPTSS